MLATKLKPLFLATAVATAATVAGMTSEAGAATLLVDDFGQLTGAQGVDVNGILYDVTFDGGNCVSAFGGCDEVADFTFNNPADALAAAQALLDQVFINTIEGAFDDDATLTAGCTLDELCFALIPYALPGIDEVAVALAGNVGAGFGGDNGTQLFPEGFPVSEPSGISAIYALFAAAPDFPEGNPDTPGADVPTPSALLLLAAGLAGLATAGRRRR